MVVVALLRVQVVGSAVLLQGGDVGHADDLHSRAAHAEGMLAAGLDEHSEALRRRTGDGQDGPRDVGDLGMHLHVHNSSRGMDLQRDDPLALVLQPVTLRGEHAEVLLGGLNICALAEVPRRNGDR